MEDLDKSMHFCLKCNSIVHGLAVYVKHYQDTCPMNQSPSVKKDSQIILPIPFAEKPGNETNVPTESEEIEHGTTANHNVTYPQQCRQSMDVNIARCIINTVSNSVETNNDRIISPQNSDDGSNFSDSQEELVQNITTSTIDSIISCTSSIGEHADKRDSLYREYLPRSLFDFLPVLELKVREPAHNVVSWTDSGPYKNLYTIPSSTSQCCSPTLSSYHQLDPDFMMMFPDSGVANEEIIEFAQSVDDVVLINKHDGNITLSVSNNTAASINESLVDDSYIIKHTDDAPQIDAHLPSHQQGQVQQETVNSPVKTSVCKAKKGSRISVRKVVTHTSHTKEKVTTKLKRTNTVVDTTMSGKQIKKSSENDRNEGIWQCEACDKTFYSSYVLSRHLTSRYHLRRSQTTCDQSYHYCKTCDMQLKSQYKLAKHLTSKHHLKAEKELGVHPDVNDDIKMLVNRRKDYQCRMCEFGCETMAMFRRHLMDDDHNQQFPSGLDKVVICVNCDADLNNASELTAHFNMSPCRKVLPFIAKTKPVKPYCLQCRQVFPTKVLLRSHQESCHPGQVSPSGTAIVCPHCGLTKRCRAVLELHIRRAHTGVRPFDCDACGCAFTDKESLIRHQGTKKHLRNALQSSLQSYSQDGANSMSSGCKFMCSLCPYHTNNRNHYEKHLRSNAHCSKVNKQLGKTEQANHDKKTQVFPVYISKGQILKQGYDTRISNNALSVLSTPSASAASNRRTVLNCSYCGSRSFSVHALRTHLLTHFPLRQHHCSQCSKPYSSRTLLLEHMLNLHPSKVIFQPNYMCALCDYRTMLHGKLVQHRKTVHDVDLPFKCDWQGCGRSFLFQSLLKVHRDKLHSRMSNFHCLLCPYKGTSREKLTRHRKVTHHIGGSVRGQFSCEFCMYRASNASHLKRHVRVHAGSKPYSCPCCTFVSSTSEGLRKHLLVTHPQFPLYPCNKCDSSFTSQAAFVKHLLDAHTITATYSEVTLINLHPELYVKDRDFTTVQEGHRVRKVKEKLSGRRKMNN